MIISDLSHVEVVTENNNAISGGFAVSNANANAFASGRNFAGTSTATFTQVSSNFFFSDAISGSSSSSAAS